MDRHFWVRFHKRMFCYSNQNSKVQFHKNSLWTQNWIMVFKNILWIMIESLWAHAAINHPAKHSVQYSNIDYFSNLILSIPKWIQLIEPNWLKNRKSLEREPWINILKAASQMVQNYIKVKKLITDFYKFV